MKHLHQRRTFLFETQSRGQAAIEPSRSDLQDPGATSDVIGTSEHPSCFPSRGLFVFKGLLTVFW